MRFLMPSRWWLLSLALLFILAACGQDHVVAPTDSTMIVQGAGESNSSGDAEEIIIPNRIGGKDYVMTYCRRPAAVRMELADELDFAVVYCSKHANELAPTYRESGYTMHVVTEPQTCRHVQIE